MVNVLPNPSFFLLETEIASEWSFSCEERRVCSSNVIPARSVEFPRIRSYIVPLFLVSLPQFPIFYAL